MRNESLAPVTHEAQFQQNAGERRSENPTLLSGKPSRTEISMRVKGIIADRTGFSVHGLRDEIRLADTGTIRSVQYALDVIEHSFDIRLEEPRSFEFFCKTTVGELISLIEGAIS